MIDPGSLVRQLDQLRHRRPHLAQVLPGLGDMLETAAEVRADLRRRLPSPALSPANREGMPLLDDAALTALEPWLLEAALAMAPVVAATLGLPGFAAWPTAARLRQALPALLRFEAAPLQRLAAKAGLELEAFVLALQEAVAPALAAAAERMSEQQDAAWKHGMHDGWCPVCGQSPSLATLGRADHDTAFLASSGGQRRFHCSLCATTWRAPKGLCPACGVSGAEGDGAGKHILHEEGRAFERLEWCGACRSYLPCLDLRELQDMPPPPLALLAFMPLDVAAQDQGLHPATPTLWNRLARREPASLEPGACHACRS